MSWYARRTFLVLVLATTVVVSGIAKTQARAPKIWDEASLADWATPIAALKIRPAHYTAAEYYSAPAHNLRTYPVYLPDKEPPGYWEELQKKKPEPLVDVSKIRTTQDWIAAGALAFSHLDNPLARTNDPALIAKARDPQTFANVPGLADGTVREPRWVVTDRGVMLTTSECSSCHATVVNRTMRGPVARDLPWRERKVGLIVRQYLMVAIDFTGPAGAALQGVINLSPGTHVATEQVSQGPVNATS